MIDHRFRDAAALVGGGYTPIPIIPETKRPAQNGWTNYQFRDSDAATYADHGIGIVTRHTPAVDIDVYDADAAAEIEKTMLGILEGEVPPERVGCAPKRLFLFKTDAPFSKKQTEKYQIEGSEKPSHVEILGHGQQFVAYGVHPDTRQPYRWNGSGNPFSVSAAALPLLTEAMADEIIARSETILRRYGEPLVRAGRGVPVGDLLPEGGAPTPWQLEELRSAMKVLSADDYDPWIKVGMALHATGWAQAKTIWDEWSRTSGKYKAGDIGEKWASFTGRSGNPVTIKTVFALAQAAGWPNPQSNGAAQAPGDPIGAIGAIGNAVSGDWDAPDLSLLEGPAVPAPAFPAEILGSYWADWCATAAKGANAPLDYTAMALLTVTAALIGNARRVAPTPAWEEPAILWTVLVGVPSSGKSPALDPLTAIVVAFEADMARDFEQTLHKYTADREMATQKKEYWKTQLKDAFKASKEAPIQPIDAQEPLPPQRPRIMIADTTMEAAADIAAANPKGLILIRDELAAWWRGFNNYGGDGERQFWLQAYGARPHTVDRKKLGRPVNIPRLSVSVLGGTQPDVLAQLLAGEEDGFVARFLYCFPDPVSGFVLSNHPIDLGGARTALQRLRGLALVEDGQSDPRPFICTLAPDAAVAFELWWGECRTEATHHAGVYGAWLGKAGGLILRLALALEHLRWCAAPFANSANSANSFPTLVSLDALQSAIRLIDDWAEPMARRAFGAAAISPSEAEATALARHLKRNKVNAFNSRELRRGKGGPGLGLGQPEKMKSACKKLSDAGLIRHAPSRAGDKSGRTRLDYDVNPKLLEC